MKKIQVATLSLLSICSLILSGCGLTSKSSMSKSSPSAPTNTPAPITITLWHGLTGTDSDTLNQVVASFEKAYPGIIIQVQSFDQDKLEQEFISEASLGKGPDILYGPKEWISTLAQARLVAALDNYQYFVAYLGLSPVALQANQYDGMTFALPVTMSSMVLWYNKAIVVTPPANSNELLTMAGQYGLALNSEFYDTAGLFFGNGSKVYNGTNTCILDQGTGTLTTLKYLLKLSQTKGVSMDTASTTLDEDFIQGKVGMIFEGSWASAQFTKALGTDKLGVANPLVMSATGAVFSPYLETENFFLSINSMGSNKSAALKFLNYMTQVPSQALFAQAGFIPTNPQVTLQGINQALYNQTQNTTYLSNGSEMGAVWSPVQTMIQSALSGNQDFQQAINTAVASINKANQH